MMLSRLVRPSKSAISQLGTSPVVQGSQLPVNSLCVVRCVTTGTKAQAPYKEGPERDLVNFPRPKRLIDPAPVRLGIFPDSWFTFFYNKTGVTGPYAFGGGLLTYLLSKEIWVLEHEFWGGVSFFMMIIYAVKKFGPQTSAYLEKEIQAELDELNAGKINEIEQNTKAIEAEKLSQFQAEGQKMLFEVKRENVSLQLEAVYRERLMEVYRSVKNRLDYQLEKTNAERNVQQKHMVDWIVSNVKKAITAESEQENIKKCIGDLKGLAARA
ncbi:ATP synthase subunit b, mitochondrial [Orchesella cincta]|uniref:ATP synthase subunit b n=1 Tax=Orchesella cincta TaxID=48709 RepID=A0A1D2NL54_ORCCI|nr:ATP synthase subunit b, mitochondrial [Orchesella cincta]